MLQPLAGGIHPRCTAAAALGSAVAGLSAGLLRLLTKAAFQEGQERLSSAVYFGVSVLMIAWCGVAHFAIKKYKQELKGAFIQQNVTESSLKSMPVHSVFNKVNHSVTVDEAALKCADEEGRVQNMLKKDEEEGELKGVSKESNEGGEVHVVSTSGGEEGNPNEEGKEEEEHNIGIGESFVFDAQEENETPSRSKMFHLFSVFYDGTLVYREAFRCAWLPITAQFFNFLITLSLFPGVGKSFDMC